MAVFLSKGVFDSEWVRLEIDEAVRLRKPIVLVHESHYQDAGYIELGQLKAEAPAHLRLLLRAIDSIPYRREAYRVHEMVTLIVAQMGTPLPEDVCMEFERLRADPGSGLRDNETLEQWIVRHELRPRKVELPSLLRDEYGVTRPEELLALSDADREEVRDQLKGIFRKRWDEALHELRLVHRHSARYQQGPERVAHASDQGSRRGPLDAPPERVSQFAKAQKSEVAEHDSCEGLDQSVMFAVLNQGVVVKTIEMEEASLKRFLGKLRKVKACGTGVLSVEVSGVLPL